MTPTAPHIPSEDTNVQTLHPATGYFVAMILIGALSGFVASLLYASYGSTATTKYETRIEQAPDGIDETRVMEATQSVASVVGAADATYATAITSDGWFIADARAVRGKKLLVRGVGSLPIEKTIVDGATNLAFIKTHAQNLHILDEENLADMARGSRLIVVLPDTALPVTLQDTSLCVADKCPYEYADTLSFAGAVVESIVPHSADGAPVITVRGTLVGFATTQNNRLVIIPTSAVKPIFQSVFTAGTITRASLPVRVANSIRSPFVFESTTSTQGFLVQTLRPTRGASDLKDDDIITSIGGSSIEGDTELFPLVQAAVADGTLHVTVLRGGKSIDLAVPLTTKISHLQ